MSLRTSLGRAGSVAAVTVTLAAATAAVTVVPAVAAPASRITVQTSDATVRSGEEFVLTGRLTPANGVVRVATRTSSGWEPLSGAVVHTRSDGTYRVRIILQRRGDRVLRVLGDPVRAGARNAVARVAVSVG